MENSVEDLFNEITENVKSNFKKERQILSFREFLDKFAENPEQYIRSAPQYLKDCFDYFGSSEVQGLTGKIQRWNIFDKECNGKTTVFGQEEVQNKIYSHIAAFSKKGRGDKIIFLHGPNGSAKSSILSCIMHGLERYSKTEEGAIYTFNWIFTEKWDKEEGSVGFRTSKKSKNSKSLAHASYDDIHFKIRSGLKDNPILLLPKEERKKFILSLLEKNNSEIPSNHPIFDIDLSHKYKEIYNELYESHQGDYEEVLRHVQVKRFYISKKYRTSAVTIEPQGNPDASSKALTLERDYDLPPRLKGANLHECYGDLVDGSRGVIEYSDFLKRPMEINKYLLTTAETGNISLGSTSAYLDSVLFATTNETQLSIFKNRVDFASFKGRFEFVKVPYLLQWPEESKIYKESILERSRGKHIAPHTIEFVSLWAILTRLLKMSKKNYSDEDMAGIADRLTGVEKADLYAYGKAPRRYNDNDGKLLESNLLKVAREFEFRIAKFEGVEGNEYEGRHGVSPREIESMFDKAFLSDENPFLSALSMLKEIEKIQGRVDTYEFLRFDKKYRYGDIKEITRQAEKEFVRWVLKDLIDSMDLVPEEEYSRLFDNYIKSVNAFMSDKKMTNPQTGKLEVPNIRFIEDVEKDLKAPKDDIASFRRSLISRVGTWSLKNKGKALDYTEIFSDFIEGLKESFREKSKEAICRIFENMKKYNHEDFDILEERDKSEVIKTFNNMKENHGYTDESVKEIVFYIMDKYDISENEDFYNRAFSMSDN